MTAARPPKKSETLEIRLPYASQLTFMERCRADGRTASDVMRDLIERGAPQAPRPRQTIRGWQALALAVAGVVIGVAAAPSIAQAWPGSRAAFDQMDANHDGGVTFAEFQGR